MSELENRLMSAIGLCMKAGKLASGEFAAEKALKSGGRLAIVDESASENTRKQWADACEFRAVPLMFVRGLGFAIGKSARMCAVVTDAGFAEMIMSAEEKLRPERTAAENAETTETTENAETAETTENAETTETTENAETAENTENTGITENKANCEKQNVHHTEAETND